MLIKNRLEKGRAGEGPGRMEIKRLEHFVRVNIKGVIPTKVRKLSWTF
jgi:hypothetical protein